MSGWQILTIYAICVILLAVPLNECVFVHYEPCVYVTNTGDCYHSKNCHYLYSSRAIGLEVAKDKGYKCCSSCYGKSTTQIRVQDTFVSLLVSFMIVSGVMIIVAVKRENKKKEVKQ